MRSPTDAATFPRERDAVRHTRAGRSRRRFPRRRGAVGTNQGVDHEVVVDRWPSQPPFAVHVYAEVERYAKGWLFTKTYTPGHADPYMRRRPPWVQERLDELDVAVDRKLRRYAITR